MMLDFQFLLVETTELMVPSIDMQPNTWYLLFVTEDRMH